MKRICIGILAHVDAGKTTLCEAMLYRSGALRTLGRVDHADAFLDTQALERERGITIFSKQAIMALGETELVLLDTPGHVDFSSEMERTLQVLDYAVLLISGTDGVQGHTRTLWGLLRRYQIPTFLFVNKMDLPACDRAALMRELQDAFGEGCVDFSQPREARDEALAVLDDALTEQYLQTGALEDGQITQLIARRRAFACYFGSALKLEGVDELLHGLRDFTRQPERPDAFGARVFKISPDAHEDHRRRAARQIAAARRGLGGKMRPASHLLRRKISACRDGAGGHGLCGDGAFAHASRRRAGL